MRINREELLRSLEAVEPGLSRREVIEQSGCFVFAEGYVSTYNDELFCRAKNPFGDKLSGAVQGRKLLDVLRKMPEEEVEVEPKNGHLVISGRNRKVGVRMDEEILLPVAEVEKPGEWRKLNPEFVEAVKLVQECASKDQSVEMWTFVHIHPKFVEACDNHQAARYRLDTGLAAPVLVRRDSLKAAVAVEATHFAEAESWIYFRNAAGFEIACRRWVDEYKDLKPMFRVEGETMTLPKGLAEAAEKAEIFSSENSDDNHVLVVLQPDKLRIKGQGQSGWYLEVKKIRYSGRPLKFVVAPKLLVEITARVTDCVVSKDRLMVDGGKLKYVACLTPVEEDN